MLRRFPAFELAADWPPRASFHVHGPASLALRFAPDGATGAQAATPGVL